MATDVATQPSTEQYALRKAFYFGPSVGKGSPAEMERLVANISGSLYSGPVSGFSGFIREEIPEIPGLTTFTSPEAEIQIRYLSLSKGQISAFIIATNDEDRTILARNRVSKIVRQHFS